MSHTVGIGVALDALFAPEHRTGQHGATVTGCTADWRRVRPGDAFVAVLDEEADGHDFAAQAVQRGAVAVIAERPIPVFTAPVYQVEDTRIALGELCHALVGNPSRSLRVIGVVGTQGKSATVALLESICAAAGYEAGVVSSLKTYDGMACGPGVDDAMTPAWLAERLARMEAAGCTHALVEISSQTLCQKKLAGVELDTVCVTMVDSQRLDLHHTTQNYRNAQRSVLEYLAAAGVAIINADDPVSCRWLSDVDGPAIAYGLGDQAQISADVIERNACETTFILAAGADSAAVRTTIVGDEHLSNCLAAAATALTHGIDLPAIARGIESVKSLPARMERIDCGQDFAVFVDAAHTACGLRASLRTARHLSRGRVICVLGDSLPATRGERAAIRGVVEKMADVTIVTDALAALDSAWLHGDESTLRQVAADRDEAIALAVAAAEPGDVVVIAGSRRPTGFNVGAARTADAETLKKLLYGLAPQSLRLVG